jgi:hypothetical protein
MYIKNYAFLIRMRYDGAALAPIWCVQMPGYEFGEKQKNGNPVLDSPEKV